MICGIYFTYGDFRPEISAMVELRNCGKSLDRNTESLEWTSFQFIYCGQTPAIKKKAEEHKRYKESDKTGSHCRPGLGKNAILQTIMWTK